MIKTETKSDNINDLKIHRPAVGSAEYDRRAIEVLTIRLARATSDDRREKLQSRIDAHRKNLEGAK